MVTHTHHILPRHAGGTDDPSNLFELSIIQHALAHRNRWVIFGDAEDYIAWMGLSGQWGKEDIIREASRLGGLMNIGSVGKPNSGSFQKGHLPNATSFKTGTIPSNKGNKTIPTCHPERRNAGRRLCSQCYGQWYYRNKVT